MVFWWEEILLFVLLVDEVLIENEGFGFNYVDVMVCNGLYWEMLLLLCVLGYEVVGIVIEVGEKVVEWWGRRVVVFMCFGGYVWYSIVKVIVVMEILGFFIEIVLVLVI